MRTYDWNGNKDMPITGEHLNDAQVAGAVRMLLRSDINHEMVVCMARDRIMCLVKENELLKTNNQDRKKLIDEILTAIQDGEVITGGRLEDWGQEAYGIEHRTGPKG